MSGRRRKSRELALQLLYQNDLAGTEPEEMFLRTEEYSGARPDVTLDTSSGALRISQNSDFGLFQSRHFALDLQISSSVRWDVTVNTGTAADSFNLSNINLGSLDINTGASREDITLGLPKGQVPITINGGALSVYLHRPAGAEASVQVTGGAVSLAGDGRQQHGIGNESWQSGGYDNAADAYRVEVNGGACTVTMDANSPPG